MKIGMLTSGGDCQGLNAALRGVAKTLYNEMGKGVTLYGIRDGYRGLIEEIVCPDFVSCVNKTINSTASIMAKKI